jgi:hypothetical protein
MPDFHLSFTLKTVFLIAAIPVSILLAAWFYRFTVPPISKQLKTVLITLRTLSILLLFLLLGDPLLSLFMHSTEDPVVAILVDNSKSMSIHDRSGDRKQVLIKTLLSSPISNLRSIGTPKYILFDAASTPIPSFSPESVKANGDGTDIGTALSRLKDATSAQNIQAAVMLTDGEFTVGTSPLYEAQELGLPVFTVGIGDSSEQKDLQIRRVLANDITYLGNRVPVNATVRSTGFNGERVEVTVQQGGTILDRKVLVLEQGTREYDVPLSFVPAKEGMQKFTVAVSKLPGELTENNNTMSFFTKVLKSKMKVLLVAGSPGQDVAFIRRALEGDKNVDLKSFIEEKNGGFYDNPLTAQAIGDADCLVLIDYPNEATSAASLALIREAVTGSKPLLFVLSRTEDFTKLQALETALPFTIGETSTNEYQVFVAIPDAENENPILKLSLGTVDAWSKLAPIFRIQAQFRAKPESEVLGTARLQTITTTDPVLLSRNVNGKKSFAVLAYGLWRWKMYGDPGSGTENLLDEFLSNTVRWLTTREDDRRFRAQPVKSMFSGQDPIEFAGQLYDENYKPVDDATVQVTITKGKQTNDIVLNALGNGQYDGSLDRLGEGDYSFAARAQQDGKTIGEDKGTFSVGGLNVEFLDTRMNKLLLQQIAARTGGKYYDVNSLETLPKDIASLPNFKPRELTRTREIELWNLQWTLTLIVLLLALEWFLRKRSGMI